MPSSATTTSLAHAIFFDQSPLPHLVVDAQCLSIVAANKAAAAFFGSTQDALQGIPLHQFLQSGECGHELLKKLSTNAAAPCFVPFQKGTQTASAQVFVTAIAAPTPLYNVMLVPGTAWVPAADEKLMADMVNENSDVLTASDLNFKPITWSKAAERLYGISHAQAIGHSLRTYTEIEYNRGSTEEVRHQLQTVGFWRGEMTLIRPTDGKKLTLLITFKLVRNEAGLPSHYVISGTDITDRVEAEAKLQESENRFREVADSAPVGIWMSEQKRKKLYINKPLSEYIGVSPEEFTASLWLRRIHPEDRHGVLKKLRAHHHECRTITLMYRLLHRSGQYRWVQDSSIPRLLSGGQFLGYIGSIIDINETKQREAQLQFQATLMNHVLDSVITTDLDLIVQTCNPVAAEVYGIDENEIIGRPLPAISKFRYITTTKDEAFADLKAKGVWRGEIDMDVRGEPRNFLFTVTYILNTGGERVGIMAVGRDITDRKRAEKKLQESEAFYRNLIADSVDGKLLTTSKGTITFATPAIEGILGYVGDDLNGRNAFEFVHPDDRPIAMEAFQNEMGGAPEVKFIEVRLLKKDGTWLWCSVRGHNLLANPHIGSMVISLHDDTQRKQANDALKESEQRFRTLIKDLKLGVLLQDAEGTVLMCNKATADLFQVPERALIGAPLYGRLKKIVHENETPLSRDEWPMLRAARTRQPVKDVVLGIRTGTKKEYRWLLINSNPVLDEAGNIRHIISSFTDVTEHKKLTQHLLEERLNQQRLLTQATIDGQERERKEIGKELHDNIGQQLATTKLYLDLAKTAATLDTNEMINRATKSITDVINEVRAVSHNLVPPTLGDLGLVESIHELIENITVVQHLKIAFEAAGFSEKGIPENGKLMLYRIIQESLNNIIKHAHATEVTIQLTRKEGTVGLRIQDNGQGFLLKKVRKGLGLSNICNRAQLFGGKVRIQSAPGAGCTLHVHIPDVSFKSAVKHR